MGWKIVMLNICATKFLIPHPLHFEFICGLNLVSKLQQIVVFQKVHHKFIGFMGSYHLNTNIMHYLKMEVVCMTFMCEQHE
jgi:hypothetical protein